MVKKHIILRKRTNPVPVNLPNGRSFTSRWKRISRKQFPINTKVSRNRTIGSRRNNRRIYFNMARPALKRIRKRRREAIVNRLGPIYDRVNQRERDALNRLGPIYDGINNQTGRGIGSNLLKTWLDIGSKALNSEFGKKLINKGIDSIPNVFKFGASKVKNKNINKALNSQIADMVVSKAQGRARKKYNSKNLFG